MAPGKYLAVVADRFVDPPALYFSDAKFTPVAIELHDGKESNLELCVRMGGRISLAAIGDGLPVAGRESSLVTAELLASEGSAPSPVYFRAPYEGGMKILDAVAPGKQHMSTELFAEGTYTLLLQVPGSGLSQRTVIIQSGQITEVVVHVPGG